MHRIKRRRRRQDEKVSSKSSERKEATSRLLSARCCSVALLLLLPVVVLSAHRAHTVLLWHNSPPLLSLFSEVPKRIDGKKAGARRSSPLRAAQSRNQTTCTPPSSNMLPSSALLASPGKTQKSPRRFSSPRAVKMQHLANESQSPHPHAERKTIRTAPLLFGVRQPAGR